MRFKKPHLTLTELGRVFGLSEFAVARQLEDVGLRTKRGKPSFTAFSEEFVDCISVRNKNCDDRYVWHGRRTVDALIENGLKPVVPPPNDLVKTPDLDGPFTIRANADSPHEIVGATGEVAVWVSGDLNAHHVCRLLNVGHRLGVLERPKSEPQPAEEPAPTEANGFVIVGVR